MESFTHVPVTLAAIATMTLVLSGCIAVDAASSVAGTAVARSGARCRYRVSHTAAIPATGAGFGHCGDRQRAGSRQRVRESCVVSALFAR